MADKVGTSEYESSIKTSTHITPAIRQRIANTTAPITIPKTIQSHSMSSDVALSVGEVLGTNKKKRKTL